MGSWARRTAALALLRASAQDAPPPADDTRAAMLYFHSFNAPFVALAPNTMKRAVSDESRRPSGTRARLREDDADAATMMERGLRIRDVGRRRWSSFGDAEVLQSFARVTPERANSVGALWSQYAFRDAADSEKLSVLWPARHFEAATL